MEVLNMPATKRLVVEMSESQHQAVKAKALLRGISMRDYVLEKLNEDSLNNDYDMEDVTSSIVEALREVGNYKNGKQELHSARDVLSSLND